MFDGNSEMDGIKMLSTLVKMQLVGKVVVCDMREHGINLMLAAFVCPGCLSWHIEIGEIDAEGYVKQLDLTGNPVTVDPAAHNEKFNTFSDAIVACLDIVQDHNPEHRDVIEHLTFTVHKLEDVLEVVPATDAMIPPPNPLAN